MSENIWTKLSAVQNEIGVLSKDANNPFFKSRYLTLDKIVANLLPLLQKHRLCLVQYPREDVLVTRVMDVDEEAFVESTCRLQCPDKDPQKQGSAITYARRYSLGCIFQIQTEEDDDGNKATFASDKQIGKIMYEVKRTGANLPKLLEYYKVKDLKELTGKQASQCIGTLARRPDKS